ncbi:MAG: tripartite tricarboxylate transporter TctB family protein [Mailhella sp.]|nr:tripartite tricarboxylate transporter TctB family protein [Mailhella sp.]
MYWVNIVSYAFCLLFSAAALAWIIPAYCPPFEGTGIASTFFPNILCWTILIASAMGILKTWKSGEGREVKNPITLRVFLRLLPFVAVIGLSFPLMRIIGFIPGGILVMAAFQLLLGERRIIHLAAVSAGVVLVYYIVFWHGLKIMLP